MYSICVKSPEGEMVEMVSSPDETFAKGAQAGIARLLHFLETDMEFEPGYEAIVVEKRHGASKSFWEAHGD